MVILFSDDGMGLSLSGFKFCGDEEPCDKTAEYLNVRSSSLSYSLADPTTGNTLAIRFIGTEFPSEGVSPRMSERIVPFHHLCTNNP